MTAKIFGIGLNKTGTTTLSTCGQILGLNCAPYDERVIADAARHDWDRLEPVIDQYDLFEVIITLNVII